MTRMPVPLPTSREQAVEVPGPAIEAARYLRALCATHARQSTVTAVAEGGPDWQVHDARLRNVRSDFFNIGHYATAPGASRYLIEQKQGALVMLLVADIDGQPAALLNLRFEPGLIGAVNLTATIQSTPSNYLRQHGGRATPFIEVARDPLAFGEIIYDGEQYDWGDYYLAKSKRYLVVRLHHAVPAPPGYCWVGIESLRDLLLEDHLLTNDLRVCVPLLSGPNSRQPAREDVGPGPVAPLQPLPFAVGESDTPGIRVGFFRSETSSREVSCWVQPLLVPQQPMRIRLGYAWSGAGRRFAIEPRTQDGLLGRRPWFPADVPDGRVQRRVSTSAEGGRFWQYRIEIELHELPAPDPSVPARCGTIVWVSEEELADLAATPLLTALELRMAWTIALAGSSPS